MNTVSRYNYLFYEKNEVKMPKSDEKWNSSMDPYTEAASRMLAVHKDLLIFIFSTSS